MDVSAGSGGTVQVNNAVLGSYPVNLSYEVGVLVLLNAIPSSGYQFDGWEGDLSGNVNNVTIEMSSEKNITAHFSEVIVHNDKIITAEFTTIKTMWWVVGGIILGISIVGLAGLWIVKRHSHKTINR